MAETIIDEQPQEVTPPETPASPPADDLDQLLQEFQDKTAPESTDNSTDAVDPLDELLAEYNQPSADQQRITELTGQVDALQLQAHRTQELEAFKLFSD